MALLLLALQAPSVAHAQSDDSAIRQVGVLPLGLVDATAVAANGKVYVFGGYDGITHRAEIHVLDPANGTVATSGALVPHMKPTNVVAGMSRMGGVFDPRDRPAAGCGEGCIYLFGGLNGDASDAILEFHPLSGTMRVLDVVLPGARYGVGVAWVDDEAFLFGGTLGGGFMTDEVLAFDPVTMTVRISDFRLPRQATDLVVAHDGTRAAIVGAWRYVELSEDGAFTVSGTSSQTMQRATAVAPFPGGGWAVLPSLGDRFTYYDPGSATSAALTATLPSPVARAAYAWDGDVLHLVGGEVDSDGERSYTRGILSYVVERDAFLDPGPRPLDGSAIAPGEGASSSSSTTILVFAGVGLLVMIGGAMAMRRKARPPGREAAHAPIPPGSPGRASTPPAAPTPPATPTPPLAPAPPIPPTAAASPSPVPPPASARELAALRTLVASIPPGPERDATEGILAELGPRPSAAEVEDARTEVQLFKEHATTRIETEAELRKARDMLLGEMGEVIAAMPGSEERAEAQRLRAAVAADPARDISQAWEELKRLDAAARIAPLRRRGEQIVARLDALLARAPDLRATREVRALVQRGVAGDVAALERAETLLAGVEPLLQERELAAQRVREIHARLAKLAQRLADGEIDGRSYESARTAMEAERASHEERVQAIASELFSEDFEKPI